LSIQQQGAATTETRTTETRTTARDATARDATTRDATALLGPAPAAIAPILARWRRVSAWPGGRRLFAIMLGRLIPYTGSVRPYVLELEPGYARVRMTDRRYVRNHLRSVHAIASANLAEVASGLAMTAGLPADVRGIVTAIELAYHKKARGTLIAECRCDIPVVATRIEVPVTSTVRDPAGDIVVTATVRWLLSPTPPATPSATRTPT